MEAARRLLQAYDGNVTIRQTFGEINAEAILL